MPNPNVGAPFVVIGLPLRSMIFVADVVGDGPGRRLDIRQLAHLSAAGLAGTEGGCDLVALEVEVRATSR